MRGYEKARAALGDALEVDARGAVTVVRVLCVNDVNGNPRRGWLLAANRGPDMFVAEDYDGEAALSLFVHAHGLRVVAYVQTELTVAPREYARLCKLAVGGA
jgi:hypothetical protein